jgi:hypothetical protein
LAPQKLGFAAEAREIVPGLTAIGGVQRVGIDTNLVVDPKEGPDETARLSRGTIQWWTWLLGDKNVLQFLSRPGILPIHHEWMKMETVTVRIVNVINVNEVKKRQDPTWLPNYLTLLRNETKQPKGRFKVSAISRPAAILDPGTYQINILTRDGKRLAGSDGNPIHWVVTF